MDLTKQVTKKTGYFFEGHIYDTKTELAQAILSSHLKLWVKGRWPQLSPGQHIHIAEDICDSLYYFKELEKEIAESVATQFVD